MQDVWQSTSWKALRTLCYLKPVEQGQRLCSQSHTSKALLSETEDYFSLVYCLLGFLIQKSMWHSWVIFQPCLWGVRIKYMELKIKNIFVVEPYWPIGYCYYCYLLYKQASFCLPFLQGKVITLRFFRKISMHLL